MRKRCTLLVAVVCTALVGSVVAIPGSVGAQVAPPAPPGQDFVITPGDLHFVLQQIRISEAHAEDVVTEDPDASPLCSDRATFDDSLHGQVWTEPDGDPCVGSPLLPHGLRTVSGRWNNLQEGQTSFGASEQVFPRLLDPEFRDAGPVVPGAPGETRPPGTTSSYQQTDGYVYDAAPRTASNLIVDQTTDNPAAVAKLLQFLDEGLDARILDDAGNELPLPAEPTADNLPEGRIFLQNVATDEGLSAPFSSWMTFFGQFFDHGLDLVEKGGNGTVVVPLAADDPLRSHPDFDPQMPYLVMSRATNAGDSRDHRNRTTPFIDQNQTYTSNPSHQVFLREYVSTPEGPVPTGALLEGDSGGLATWEDVKEQASTVLGIDLVDADVVNVPHVVTDPYGRFVPDPATGFPLLTTLVDPSDPDGAVLNVAGDPTANGGRGISTQDAARVDHAFLDDIAHTAVPVDTQGDLLLRGEVQEGEPLPPGQYDGGLLDAHFVTGDGRGNENIALTAVHHVFHSEHNRLIGQIEAVIAQDAADPNGFGLQAGYEEEGTFWDYQERIFQTARFFNEMQYQHLAVEEFLRTVAPTMDAQPLNESAYHSELNAAITAEFAHVVYRFGHSMLTEDLPRTYTDGTSETVSLLDGFLNPREFDKDGTLSHDEAAASVILGTANQVGNGIDEFVTDTLRNNLLGLPLDLATINMARGRDTGIPPLQSARRQFYAATLDPTLKPYAHWEEFRLEMKHRDSVVNFIAAYGKGDAQLEAATTLEAKRARAVELAADGTYMTRPSAETGLDDVDFWVGGLAERTMVFGGMLGSTFNYVFESQAELLQNADRFYYLTRTQGQNLLGQLEANSFSELIQRNTTATALPFDVFAFPDPVIRLDDLDPDPANWPAGLVEVGGTIRYDGGEHIVMYGTLGDDAMQGGEGDDTLWGRAGRDRMEGGDGADSIIGGDGDDVITDIFGDDTILGGAGSDAIRGGPGEDLLLPGSGNDFTMVTKDDLNNVFNGVGNDFVLGGTGNDRIWGGDDDDWIEGGNGHDLLQGDNAIIWQNDPTGGHDVIIGGPGNNDHDSDGGDDIIVAGPGVDRNEGMLGFDWVTYKGHGQPVIADMRFTGLMPPDIAGMRDRFDLVEGLSGWEGNDILRGLTGIDDVVEGGQGHVLTEEHLDRVEGLRELLKAYPAPPAPHTNYACRFMGTACGLPASDSDGISNLILAGGGSDTVEGRAGDDFLDGDRWLDVEIEWAKPDGTTERFSSMLEIGDRVINGAIDPDDLSIRRSIKPPAAPGGLDTAIYGNPLEQYTLTYLADDHWEVFHDGAAELEESDGRDVLRGFERLQFADQCVILDPVSPGTFEACPTYGSVELDDHSPVEDQAITATVSIDPALVSNPTNLTWEWQFGEDGEEWEPSPNPSTDQGNQSTFTPRDAEPGNHLRVVVSFDDDQGNRQTIASPRTENPVLNVNDPPVGPEIIPATPAVGDMLTAINLIDDDGIESIVEDQTVTYRWQHSSGGGWVDITTTSVPYLPVTPDLQGSVLRVIAEYTDDHGFAEQAASAPTAPVGSQAPNNPPVGTPELAGPPQINETLVVTAAGVVSDPDGITVDDQGEPVFTYQWQVMDGGAWVDVPGATQRSFVPTDEALVGARLRAVVSYTDLRGFAEQVASNASEPIVAAPGEELPHLRAVPTGVAEGDLGPSTVQVTVELSAPSTETVSVNWSTYDAHDQPRVGLDYEAGAGTLVFAPGETTATVPFTALGDTLDEGTPATLNAEWGGIVLSSPTNATIGAGTDAGAYVLIVDDDPTPTVSGFAGRVVEGDAGTTTVEVPVLLSAPSGLPVTVAWETIATEQPEPGADFAAASGTVTFQPGQTTATVAITVHGDTVDEPGQIWNTEWGGILLSSPSNARIGSDWWGGLGLFLIVDDD